MQVLPDSALRKEAPSDAVRRIAGLSRARYHFRGCYLAEPMSHTGVFIAPIEKNASGSKLVGHGAP